MKKKLPYPVYIKWKNAIRKEELLDKDTSDIIAHAMKEWVIENGVTHYCHWFKPLNGVTAKKHESFIDKSEENLPIVRFSGEKLLKSEPDASSFPNGGMRSTFEARGYTYWDCTANAFIMNNNQVVMEVLRTTAYEHNLVCLLHEKPFKGVNESGKHNNWSLTTNFGKNLFKLPKGNDKVDELLFSIFMVATISAVSKYSTLLRISSSSVRNDLRLGGDEAPPAIVSIYLGNEVENKIYEILGIEHKNNISNSDFNINNLGFTPRDNDDRNRTSPFAYTGGKFEFRMQGSMQSAADSNIVLNTIVDAELKYIFDNLKHYTNKEEMSTACKNLLKNILKENSRILFSGDNYSNEWEKEAKKRELHNHKSYLEALLYAKESKEYEVLLENSIFTPSELNAIYDICVEDIINSYLLDINTLSNMLHKDILPACMKQLDFETKLNLKIQNTKTEQRIQNFNTYINEILETIEQFNKLHNDITALPKIEKAQLLHNTVSSTLEKIRQMADKIETLVSRENWTIPTYEEIFRPLN